MKKRYQVFISSTLDDLEEERKGVIEAILKCNCFPAAMEFFPAASVEQFEYIKKDIDESDYFVLIIAGRYGTLADNDLSYTEKEFNYAKEKGIPILAFLKNNLDDIPVKYTDKNKKKNQKLNAFIEKVKSSRIVQFWDTKDQLMCAVTHSLIKAPDICPRDGWIRYSESCSNQSRSNYINSTGIVTVYAGTKYEDGYFDVKVIIKDIVLILGNLLFNGCWESTLIESDYYEEEVEELLINNIKEQNYSFYEKYIKNGKMLYHLDNVNTRLRALRIIQTQVTEYEWYYITLTELGKDIYNEILNG